MTERLEIQEEAQTNKNHQLDMVAFFIRINWFQISRHHVLIFLIEIIVISAILA